MNWPEPLLPAVRCYLGGDDAALHPIGTEIAKHTRSRYRSLDHWQGEGRNYKDADKPRSKPGPATIEVRYP